MLEKYYSQKIIDKDYVIFIKSDNFYELFEKDALIINKILEYKIKRFLKSFKTGFPVSKLEDVLKVLEDNDTNYLVIDDKETKRKKFENNMYFEFDFDIDKVMLNYLKIDKITNYLNNNVLNENLTNILNEIEKKLLYKGNS